ncbi:hypothetical protein EJB05_46955, partial [Eragrostis curvula]
HYLSPRKILWSMAEITKYLQENPEYAGITSAQFSFEAPTDESTILLRGNDEDIAPSDTTNTPPLYMQSSITRAHARRLNLRVSSFQIMSSLHVFENKMLPNDLIIVRNHGDDDEISREVLGVVEGQQGRTSQVGGPIQVDFESVSEFGSSLQGLAFSARSIVHCRLITRGDVVLRLQGSERVVRKPDRFVSILRQIVVYLNLSENRDPSSHQEKTKVYS